MSATIETVKEKLQAALQEIDNLLEQVETDPGLVDDDTHDELIDVAEVIGGFLGEEADEEGPLEGEIVD